MSTTSSIPLLRGTMLLGLAAVGAIVAAAVMVSQAEADLNRSDMDGYSYDGSETACVDPDKWKDPFTIAFVDGATPGLVAQQAHDYGYIWDDSDPDQRFYDNDHCGFEHTDTANEPNNPLQSRFHMRTRTGSDGYLGQYDWDPTWGVFSVATPHYDKAVG